jgi:drug/metabolite transporter (DMT)-like permease
MTPREPREGALLLLAVVLTWGITWPVNKAVLETVPPLWAVTLRTSIASIALMAAGLVTRRLALPPRDDLPIMLSITLLHMAGFTALTSIGLQVVPTGRSVVLAYTTPLWVMPGARLFLGERLTARRLLGVAIGIVGLVVLFNPIAFEWTRREALIGNGAILLAAFLWAGSILHTRGHRWRSTPYALLPWQTMLATAILAPLSFALEGPLEAAWTPRLIALLLYGGLLGTVLPYWALPMAGRRLPAVTVALGLLGTPVVSTIVATVWLREPITWTLATAIVLILGGVALGARAEASRGSEAPPRRR